MGEPKPGRIELPYLDGIRAVAALLVVVYHAYLFTGRTGDAPRNIPLIGDIVGWGYLGVPVFIVLSGYVLMLPSLRTPQLKVSGGNFTFLKRRARRILPPYYAALGVTLLLIWFVPLFQTPMGTQWDSKVPVTVGDVISHLFLVHDFSPDWIGKINGPMWSVAIEWHIYFLMPFVLLPLWRRVPPVVIVGVLLALSLIPVAIGQGGYLHPWFVGLFAAGMWSAQLTVRTDKVRRMGAASGGLLIIAIASVIIDRVTGHDLTFATETLIGLSVAALLVRIGRRSIAGEHSALVSFLGSRPLLGVGLFSYSLYLLHSPLLGFANLLLLPLGLSTLGQWAVLTFVVVPIDIAVCYAFYLLIERRFLNARQKHAVQELAAEGHHE